MTIFIRHVFREAHPTDSYNFTLGSNQCGVEETIIVKVIATTVNILYHKVHSMMAYPMRRMFIMYYQQTATLIIEEELILMEW